MELRARRKPWLLFRFDGLFLFRFAERAFAAVLFQLPPRFTRLVPDAAPLAAPVLTERHGGSPRKRRVR